MGTLEMDFFTFSRYIIFPKGPSEKTPMEPVLTSTSRAIRLKGPAPAALPLQLLRLGTWSRVELGQMPMI